MHALIFMSTGCASLCEQDLYNILLFKTNIYSKKKEERNKERNGTELEGKKVDHSQSMSTNQLQAQLL